MQISKFLAGCGLVMCTSLATVAQPSSTAKKPAEPTPEIRAILLDVSPQQIEATIDKLVSFGNRSTLSSGVCSEVSIQCPVSRMVACSTSSSTCEQEQGARPKLCAQSRGMRLESRFGKSASSTAAASPSAKTSG